MIQYYILSTLVGLNIDPVWQVEKSLVFMLFIQTVTWFALAVLFLFVF